MSLTPNASAAVDFLRWLRPTGSWALTAISPDNKGSVTKTFEPGDADACLAWIADQNNSRNIYYHVNPTKPIDKKASKGDITHLEFLHVDIDARAGEDVEAECKRIFKMLNDWDGPEPSGVVFTGGGFQAIWRLDVGDKPIVLNGDTTFIEQAERYNVQLEHELEGDHCHNVDRLLRLPGTINWPSEKKRRRGRVSVLAEAVVTTPAAYPLSTFTAAEPKKKQQASFGTLRPTAAAPTNVRRIDSVDELTKLNDDMKVLIVNGFDPDDETRHHGGDKSRALWAVMCAMVKAGYSDEEIYAVVTDPSLGISTHILNQGARAESYAMRQIERAREFAIHPFLKEMNERHTVIGDMGGKCRVISWIDDEGLDRQRLSKQTFDDIRNRYLHVRIEVGKDKEGHPKFENGGSWWLKSEHRSYYHRVAFAPDGKVGEGVMNLWQGFAFAPREGDCSLFLEHVRQNICGGDAERFEYLMKWMARLVQEPASPGYSAIVLRGAEGVGKGFLARKLGKLVGRHFVHVTQGKHLTGEFNYHLRDALVVFADEATFAGDRQHASTLKAVITEPTIMVTSKGIDSETAPNYIHLIMASNEDWVVPAGPTARRFFVLDVSSAHMNDAAYFDKIDDQLNAGGYEALMHILTTMDISDFRVGEVPKTEALAAQQRYTMSHDESWWYEKLVEGRIFPDDDEWPEEVLTLEMQEDYTRTLRRFGGRSHANGTRLGQFLKKVCPAIEKIQTRKERQVEIDGERKTIKKPYVYRLPPLAVCREAFRPNHDWPQIATEDTPEAPF